MLSDLSDGLIVILKSLGETGGEHMSWQEDGWGEIQSEEVK
jgi:hypothetical protein